MSVVTVINLPEETHRALKARAAEHNRSIEAEIRFILEEVVRPKDRVKLGTALAAFGKQFGGLEFAIIRDHRPTEPASFE